MVDGDRIDSFFLSCRILGKGIEMAFAKSILRLLKDKGVTNVKASYLPTAKNAQVSDFYDRCGFDCTALHDNGAKDYVLNLTDADLSIEKYYHIEFK